MMKLRSALALALALVCTPAFAQVNQGTSPLSVPKGGIGLASGTPGGVLCFTAATTISSSVAATANAIMLGGGPGACPSPLGSLGTATTVLHGNAAGGPSFGSIVQGDIANNAVGNTQLGQMPANTVKCNATGSAANAQDCTNPSIAGVTLAPTASSLNQAFTTTQSISGATSVNCVAGSNQFPCVNLFAITADNANAATPSNALDGWQFNHTFGGANLQGARQALDVIANFNAASSASNPNRFYVAGVFETNASSGDGGSAATSPATAKGAVFGSNSVVRTTAAATNLSQVTATEFDVAHAGTAAAVLGISVVRFPGNQASWTPAGMPVVADAAIGIGAATAPGATNWANGILFNSFGGIAPVGGGCLICTDGVAATVGSGIDISAYTTTGPAFKSKNFQIDGSGNLTANNITPAWTTYTATITPGAGAITTQTSDSTFLQAGKWVRAEIHVTVSAIGTGAVPITANVPVAAKHNGSTCTGREAGVSGKAISGVMSSGSTVMTIQNYDNTSPTFSNGVRYDFTCSYEAQ